MGWWKANGTEDTIGDVPLDALGGAVSAVLAEYQAELGRKPTKREWEAMLCAVLGNEMPQYRCMVEGIVADVSIELK